MNFQLITLFPEIFDVLTQTGITRRAHDKGLYTLNCVNPRQFTADKHQSVDDRPFGGGPGMVMMADPLAQAVEFVQQQYPSTRSRVLYLSPQGAPLSQKKLTQLQNYDQWIVVCGRYEGVDERFIQSHVDEEIAIGDFVVSGGELPALMLLDGAIRLLPGALGHPLSAVEDSFQNQLLDCPHYTRPEVWREQSVPSVLLSGHHAQIEQWRQQQKQQRTQARRPDLCLTKN